MSYQQQSYALKKPFSSFLSGVAGIQGIPMWVYYVNKGQLIASFGLRDKNGAMLEFVPANQAYELIAQKGFRTFIKVDGNVFECFQVAHANNQSLHVEKHDVSIIEKIEALDLTIKVTYFTLPETPIAGFLRKVTIEFGKNAPKTIEVVDGLTHILPAKLDAGLLKNMSHTLRSWMVCVPTKEAMYYKLSASIGDTAEVQMIEDVNTYQTFGLKHYHYIYDLSILFDEDTTLSFPHALNHGLAFEKQSAVNHIPAAMTYTTLNQTTTFISMFSYAENQKQYETATQDFHLNFLLEKEKENEALHHTLTRVVQTETAHPHFNAYLEYSYMDNVLRGGTPFMLETKDGFIPYYVYSRKHGDLERDYNFFSIEANVMSQGNGNFRDVLQNRRNDLFFEPKIKAFNIIQFASFIQADGYNPLNIAGLSFHYEGSSVSKDIDPLLQHAYTPGQLLKILKKYNQVTLFDSIIKESRVSFVAHFHEGYWEDHFTYIYDLIETYQAIYPDQMASMLFDQPVTYFVSEAVVQPRKHKYMKLADDRIRQYRAERHVHRSSHALVDQDNNRIKHSVFSKLFTLVVNKFMHLDPESKGLMYEGGKPGWNDAMNGLPGLFGSGVSELFELYKLISFLHTQALQLQPAKIDVLKPLVSLIETLNQIDLHQFDERMTALELYREAIEGPMSSSTLLLKTVLSTLEKMEKHVTVSIKFYESKPLIPTYLTYEAVDYDEIQVEGDVTFVDVKRFKQLDVPYFLEAHARFLKSVATQEVAIKLHHNVLASEIYDQKLKMFKTSAPLNDASYELGRIKAFTAGWLERESIFLHMTYKYLLGLLVSGAYDAFYESIQTNMICFLDENVYGRSTLENSSFLASSKNPDERLHGQGFVARLSGSTAEMLSMWRYMFLGKALFTFNNNQLAFQLKPLLKASWFKQGRLKTTLFSNISIVYHYEGQTDTFNDDVFVERYVLIDDHHQSHEVHGESVIGLLANKIRSQQIIEIEVTLKECS
jgi:uncharacterized protein (DUF2267 family)